MAKKGSIPWNKGIKGYHVHGEKQKEFMKQVGLKNKGKKRPYLSKRNKERKGWKHKPETIELMKKIRKGTNFWTEETARKVGRILRKHPNKKEELLEKLIKLNNFPYKFVGNGKFAIEAFNPDFINCNGQKKIIELYGDYWHSKEKIKDRDKRRIQTYLKYGFKTLIIWEKELQNKVNVINRIQEFDRGD